MIALIFFFFLEVWLWTKNRAGHLLLDAEGRPRAAVTAGQYPTVDLQCLPKGHMLIGTRAGFVEEVRSPVCP